jgi:hypothetical protein
VNGDPQPRRPEFETGRQPGERTTRNQRARAGGVERPAHPTSDRETVSKFTLATLPNVRNEQVGTKRILL